MSNRTCPFRQVQSNGDGQGYLTFSYSVVKALILRREPNFRKLGLICRHTHTMTAPRTPISNPAISYTSGSPRFPSLGSTGSDPGTTLLAPSLLGSFLFVNPCPITRTASIKSSSAVVRAPMKQRSRFIPSHSWTGTTSSGFGYRVEKMNVNYPNQSRESLCILHRYLV